MSDSDSSLIIKGIAIDPRLIEARPWQRCRLHECQGHCCGGGVYVSLAQAQQILIHQDLFIPYLPPERRDPQKWFDWIVEAETDHPDGGFVTSTATVTDPTHPMGSTCIFMLADRKCVLQLASVEHGTGPWHYKPFYCALHPVTFFERQLTLDSDNPIFVEGGSCCQPHPGQWIPLYQLFDLEVKLALGEDGYAELEAYARRQQLH